MYIHISHACKTDNVVLTSRVLGKFRRHSTGSRGFLVNTGRYQNHLRIFAQSEILTDYFQPQLLQLDGKENQVFQILNQLFWIKVSTKWSDAL